MPLAGRDVHLMTISADDAVTLVDPVHPSTRNDAIEVRPADPVHHAHICYVWNVESSRYGHNMHSRRAPLQVLGRRSTGPSLRHTR
jgi:hypothetical protein